MTIYGIIVDPFLKSSPGHLKHKMKIFQLLILWPTNVILQTIPLDNSLPNKKK